MSELLPGTPVVARGLRWEVVFSQPIGEQTLYRLRALDGALRGEELELLSPFEPLEPVVQELAPDRAAPLHHWRLYHQGFLLEQELGPTALLAAQPGRLSPAPYQLVPVMRVLRQSRPRLLLADGVGLGKTVETGLILAELIARRRAHRILVVSPAGPLLEQWRREMRERFGLRFRVLDRDSLQDIRHASELGANPFDAEALGLISIDFAKQEKVLQDLERSHFDVVVIDEAHHVASVGSAGTAEDSQRRRLAELLARQSDGLLLLSATPHDGYDAHFASLVALLDPSLVDGRGLLRADAYRRFVVRRLKRHVRGTTGGLAYDDRRVIPSRVDATEASAPAWAHFQRELLALVAPQLRKAFRARRFGDVLAFVSLLKRSVSTVFACRKTLEVIGQRLGALEAQGSETLDARRQRLTTLREYRRRLERFGTLSFEEEQDQAALEAEDIAAELALSVEETQAEVRSASRSLSKVGTVRSAIESLAAAALLAEPQDPKLAALVKEVRAIREVEPRANVLLYSEYADSQAAVVAALKAAVERGEIEGAVEQISGTDDEKTREAVTHRFSTRDGLVLVSTDATAEGLNLHARCHHLVHVELPYNPNRLEQRNGRIDRFGQTKQPIVRYLYLPATFEERLLLRLVQKYEKQRARLSFVPNTLGIVAGDGEREVEGLLRGLSTEDERLFKPAPLDFAEGEAEDTGSTEYRELLAEIDRAIGGFEKAAKSHEWLGIRGIAADPRDTEEAAEAQTRGLQLVSSELLDFVCDAVAADNAAAPKKADGVVELSLPTAWAFGLDDMPGWDAEARILRLTERLDQTEDSKGRSLGYLGRAHPIVRRALDRVRHVQFAGGGSSLDPRVSAARWDGVEPAALWTYVGQVRTSQGREYERVIAVRVEKSGQVEVVSGPDWFAGLAAPDRALNTSGVWKSSFASWVAGSEERARAAGAKAFEALAADFIGHLSGELEAERRQTVEWLASRALELCGPIAVEQTDLFGPLQGLAPWKRNQLPGERLAAFATDSAVSAKERREAEGVLRLYRGRMARLVDRQRFDVTVLSTLGLLLLVPGAN